MSYRQAFDSVLASLARPFSRNADTLLDLREWSGDERKVGSYVRAYFELHRTVAAGEEAVRGLGGYRRWLEQHVEIAVLHGITSECLEAWPLNLAGETDLETFCRRAMERVREDRCHEAPRLHLEFRFRELVAEAA